MSEQNKSDEYLISVETFMKNGNFKDALFFCDKILQEDKQNAKAYFFKLLIKNEKTDVTWENSSIRKYLNDIYYYTFSEEDRNLICEVENDNSDSNNSHGLAGNNTKDRVYILSIKQAYAVNEAFLNINKKQWLRSLGSDEGCAAFIDENGVISTGGESVNSIMCVRPVIKVRLGKP